MPWWIVYERASGKQVSESSVDPSKGLPGKLRAVEVPERPVPEKYFWDVNNRKLATVAAKPKAVVTTTAKAAKGSPAITEISLAGVARRATVFYQVALKPAPSDGTTALLPVDRVDMHGNVMEAAAVWVRLLFTDGVGIGSAVYDRSGRYGVGPQSSDVWDVSPSYVTVLAS